MILFSSAADELVLTTQTDHAFFAAELLALWRTDSLPEHPRRGEILFAAREHDNGWREADAAPRVREDGRPHDFLSIPDAVRFEIWQRGVARFYEQHPYASLLTAWHARALHEHHRGAADWKEFLEGLDTACEALLDATATEASAVERDYAFLELVDLISLVVCNRWNREMELHGYRFRCEGDILHLDPLPLAGATSFEIRCRRIPDRRYTGDADLGVELATAPWERRRIQVR
jgi:hypothetical protein